MSPPDDTAATTDEAERLRNELRSLRERYDTLLAELREREGALMSDLMAAQRFQRSILPPLPSLSGLEIEVMYEPVDLVGGDIYDVTALDPEHLRIFIADATGHGVTASLATMFIKSEYEIIKRTVKGPGGILRVMNERIARTYKQLQMRFTALCFNVDLKKRLISYASAAHPAPYLVRQGAAIELESGGPFMGVLPEVAFPEGRVDFQPGDALFAFTDGLIDATGPDGKPFGEWRIQDALTLAVKTHRPTSLVVQAQLDDFVGKGKGQNDDITIVGLRWTGLDLPTDGSTSDTF